MTPKVWVTKDKTDELDFIKIKNFWASEDSEQREKRTHGVGKNIWKLYKELVLELTIFICTVRWH